MKWYDFRESLQAEIKNSPLVHALENRLFEGVQKFSTLGKGIVRCTICKSSNVEYFCNKCQNSTCSECAHKINHDDSYEIYCRNCVEQLFSWWFIFLKNIKSCLLLYF